MENNMTEYWNFHNEYKFYSEDFNLLRQLSKITGARVHTKYFKNEKLVAMDVIIPRNRLEFAKKMCKKLFFIK